MEGEDRSEEVVQDDQELNPANCTEEKEVPKGTIGISVSKVTVAPENDDVGLWFRWTIANLPKEMGSQLAPENESKDDEEGETIIRQGISQVVECVSGTFGYDGYIDGIPLTDSAISQLACCDSDILVEAFVGDSHDPENDTLVGKIVIPVEPLLTSDGVSTRSFSFLSAPVVTEEEEASVPKTPTKDIQKKDNKKKKETPKKKGGAVKGDKETNMEIMELKLLNVTIELRSNEALARFCEGGRILRISDPVMCSFPQVWGDLFAAGNSRVALELDGRTLGHGVLVLSEEDPEQQDEGEDKANEGEPQQRLMWDQENSSFVPLFLRKETIESFVSCGFNFNEIKCVLLGDSASDEEACWWGTSLLNLTGLEELDCCGVNAIVNIDLYERHVQQVEEGISPRANDDKLPTPRVITSERGQSELKFGVEIVPAVCTHKVPPKPQLRTPRQVIEGRPPRKMKTIGGEEMIDTHVREIANWVAEEFSQMITQTKQGLDEIMQQNDDQGFGTLTPGSRSGSPIAECCLSASGRRAKLLYTLSTNGKYKHIRAKLKQAVCKYVSERKAQLKESGDEDMLHSLIYENVMKLVHRSLNAKWEAAKRGKAVLNQCTVDSKALNENLGHLMACAFDAIFANDLVKAEAYFQERVGEAERISLLVAEHDVPVDPSVWHDYAVFALQQNDVYRAVAAECLRSAIAISDNYIPSLVAYGALLSEVGTEEEQVEIFLDAAANLPLSRGLGGPDEMKNRYAAHGLLYLLNKRLGTTEEASKVVPEQVESEALRQIYLITKALEICLPLNFPSLCARLLEERQSAISNTCISCNKVRVANLYNSKLFQGWYHISVNKLQEAVVFLEQAEELNRDLPDAYILHGNILFQLEDFENAREMYQRALSMWDKAKNTESVWMVSIGDFQYHRMLSRLSTLYLGDGEFGKAKQLFLRLCSLWPSCTSWVGVGAACLHNGELKQALDAFSEANIIDRKNPEVWGYLALTCHRMHSAGHKDFSKLSKRSFDQALGLGLSDPKMLQELGACFMDGGNLTLAEKALEKSVALSPTFSAKMKLATTLLMKNQYEHALKVVNGLQIQSAEEKQELVAFSNLFKSRKPQFAQ